MIKLLITVSTLFLLVFTAKSQSINDSLNLKLHTLKQERNKYFIHAGIDAAVSITSLIIAPKVQEIDPYKTLPVAGYYTLLGTSALFGTVTVFELYYGLKTTFKVKKLKKQIRLLSK